MVDFVFFIFWSVPSILGHKGLIAIMFPCGHDFGSHIIFFYAARDCIFLLFYCLNS